MRSKPAVIAACLIFATPALSLAADTPFPGIYSVIDPVTGMTQDVLKIEPLHDWQPRADEAKISARSTQVGVSDAGNPANAVDTDPLTPYMSSAAHCGGRQAMTAGTVPYQATASSVGWRLLDISTLS